MTEDELDEAFARIDRAAALERAVQARWDEFHRQNPQVPLVDIAIPVDGARLHLIGRPVRAGVTVAAVPRHVVERAHALAAHTRRVRAVVAAEEVRYQAAMREHHGARRAGHSGPRRSPTLPS